MTSLALQGPSPATKHSVIVSKISLYTIAGCGFCVHARRLLESKNASFEEFDLSSDYGARGDLIARTGHRTFPQVFVNEEFLGGCDELMALDRAGRLDALLA